MNKMNKKKRRKKQHTTTKTFSCVPSVGQTSTKFKIQTYSKICIHMF